jgi:hypothetical protein
MLKVRSWFVAVVVLVIAGAVLSAAEKDFATRWKEAETHVTAGPGQPYFKDTFFKDSQDKFSAHISACAKQTGEVPTTDLRAAVELGSKGQVLAVLLQAPSKTGGCFGERIKKDSFPAPPADHFWVPVEMRFSKQ